MSRGAGVRGPQVSRAEQVSRLVEITAGFLGHRQGRGVQNSVTVWRALSEKRSLAERQVGKTQTVTVAKESHKGYD